jgi:hypothetical protein
LGIHLLNLFAMYEMNENGVIQNPTEFYWATNGQTQTILSIGEYGGLWGYGCQVMAKNSGFAVPCMPLVHRYASREQAETAARLRAGVPIEAQLTLFPA